MLSAQLKIQPAVNYFSQFKKKEITPRKNNEDSKLKNKLLLSIFILNLFKIELLKKLPIIEIKNIKKI